MPQKQICLHLRTKLGQICPGLFGESQSRRIGRSISTRTSDPDNEKHSLHFPLNFSQKILTSRIETPQKVFS